MIIFHIANEFFKIFDTSNVNKHHNTNMKMEKIK